MKLKAFAYRLLDYSTRTWSALFGTLIFTAIYLVWNVIGKHALVFDPYPFLFLCMIITILSYLQNIVIMTIQREDSDVQRVIEAKQREMFQKLYDMVEDVHEDITEEENKSAK